MRSQQSPPSPSQHRVSSADLSLAPFALPLRSCHLCGHDPLSIEALRLHHTSREPQDRFKAAQPRWSASPQHQPSAAASRIIRNGGKSQTRRAHAEDNLSTADAAVGATQAETASPCPCSIRGSRPIRRKGSQA